MGRMQCLQSAVSAPAHWSISSTRLHARPKTDAVKLKVGILHVAASSVARTQFGCSCSAHSVHGCKLCPYLSNVVIISGMQRMWLCVVKDSFVIVTVQGHVYIPYDVSQ